MSRNITESARQAAEKVSGLYMDDEIAVFVEKMSREHRTRQQNFTRLCTRWLKYLSGVQEYGYDLRNEASVRLAKKFAESVPADDQILPFI